MHGLARKRLVRLAAPAAALALTAAGAIGATAPPASAATTVSVSVDVDQALATIPSAGVGTNVAVYDGNMNGSAAAGLLSAAGMNAVRYPGGSYADVYHWQTGTAEGGAFLAPGTGFDAFMGKDPNNAATVSLDYSGFTPGQCRPTVYSYMENGTSITSAGVRSATRQTVPPYSIVVVQVHP